MAKANPTVSKSERIRVRAWIKKAQKELTAHDAAFPGDKSQRRQKIVNDIAYWNEALSSGHWPGSDWIQGHKQNNPTPVLRHNPEVIYANADERPDPAITLDTKYDLESAHAYAQGLCHAGTAAHVVVGFRNGIKVFDVVLGEGKDSEPVFVQTNGSRNKRQTARKRNPESGLDSAVDKFRDFHGEDPSSVVKFIDEIEVPDNYVKLGGLVSLKVATPDGKREYELAFIEDGDTAEPDTSTGVFLCCDPGGKQLYFVGGDQSVDLADPMLRLKDSQHKPKTLLGTLLEVTYRTRKGFDRFQLTDYYHALGEETGDVPVLVYDSINEKLSVVGGAYDIRPEGIVN